MDRGSLTQGARGAQKEGRRLPCQPGYTSQNQYVLLAWLNKARRRPELIAPASSYRYPISSYRRLNRLLAF